MAAFLTTLPEELHAKILFYVTRLTDLQNACCASKEMKDLAMPCLYHSVKLNLHRDQVYQEGGFLKHKHPGHQFIRSLTLLSKRTRGRDLKPRMQDMFNHTIIQILRALPEDNLEDFRFQAGISLHKDTLAALYISQRKLRVLHVGRMPRELDLVAMHPTKWLTSLHTSNAFTGTGEDSHNEFFCDILRWCTKLRCLKGIFIENLVRLTKSMQAEGEWPGPESPIRELDFHSWPDHSWMYRYVPLAINLQHLRYLAINRCVHLDVVLEMVTKEVEPSGTALRGFGCEVHEDFHQSQTLAAVHKFLESFSTLEYIQVVSHWKEQFDLDCLGNHSSTLKHVYIGPGGCDSDCGVSMNGQQWSPMSGQWRVDPDKFSAFVERTHGLQQIALALPSVAVAPTHRGGLGKFGEILDLLSIVSDLRVLRILKWPSTDTPMFSGQSYKANLDAFAALVVDRLNKSQRRGEGLTPRVLCFGDNMFSRSPVSGEQSLSSMHSVCYAVSSSENTRPVVEQTEAGQVQYEEPLWDRSDYIFRGDSGLCLGGVKTVE